MSTYFDEIPDTPTGVDPEVEAKHQVRADARSRSWRSLGQGALVAVLLAVSGVVYTALNSGELPDWRFLGIAVLQAAGTALASYVHRVLNGEALPA
ncbi:hypothetical protein ACFWY5_29810 [Nonomuraea sp. NPDC059007]|uniref:hypothetical protein n=1 Tax=Nonomuraea sp. NPDC059007 TaxID=3346692 RepID=UPI0036D0EC92